MDGEVEVVTVAAAAVVVVIVVICLVSEDVAREAEGRENFGGEEGMGSDEVEKEA